MKKVKIMLLSLALIAVVGGALAFKSKLGSTFCTAPAYGSSSTQFYCDFDTDPNPNVTVLTTTACVNAIIDGVTTAGTGICTSPALGSCPQDCPNPASGFRLD